MANVDGFSATVNPPSAVIHPGEAVTVQVDVHLTSDTLPDKSSHNFVVSARDGCKVLNASTNVTVSIRSSYIVLSSYLEI